MRTILTFFLAFFLVFGTTIAQSFRGNQLAQKGISNRNILIRNTASINSEGLEFSPVLYQNGLVYVSRHNSGPVDEKTGERFFELFYAELSPNGMPFKSQAFSTEINSHRHEGPVAFNRRGDKIFFTRSNLKKGLTKADSKGRVRLKIYEAEKGYFDWENVREMTFNNNEYSCMHPALSADGTKLYFSSDMPGGFGGMDLYVVKNFNGKWSDPINLGPEVNTNKNEVFPFSHESGMLFFASNGHQGIGGLDLFMIDLSKRKWGNVISLGMPFNSPEDDLGLVLTTDGTRGYFSSNRKGGIGEDDIYMFEAPEGIKGIELQEKISALLNVYDANTSRRLAGAAIRIFEKSSDGLINNEELYNLELLPTSANSEEMTLKLIRKKEEELGKPDFFTNRSGEVSMSLVGEKEYLILVSKAGYTTQEVPYSTKEVTKIRPIEVALEPSNCLNLQGLVLTELIKQKIPNAIIRVINECDGSEQVLRSNIYGEFEFCLPIGCDFTINGEKAGFDPGSTEVSTVKIRGSRSITAEVILRPNSKAAIKEPIRKGTVIVLENIYYDFNKSAIRAGEARDLEALAKLMKLYPSMEIELGAHTDARGTEGYNLNLSLKRAESAKRFLMRKGIAGNRIKSFGYGEAFPRNKCADGTDCTEEEHQYNRRTEVKIARIDEGTNVKIDRK